MCASLVQRCFAQCTLISCFLSVESSFTVSLAQWNLGVGYASADYQAAVFLNDASVVTGLYAHSVTPSVTVASEVGHNLGSKVTTFSAGGVWLCVCVQGWKKSCVDS